jgi:serine/threonine protein kinase
MFDRKFIEVLSGENIERLSLKIVGGHGEEVKFNDLYEYKHFLGKGGFGYVVSAVHRETNKACALKVSSQLKLNSQSAIDRRHNLPVRCQMREKRNQLSIRIATPPEHHRLPPC